MSVLIVRGTVKPEHAAEAEAGVQKMFSALAEAQPEGIRYASLKLPDGLTFVAILQVEDGIENPLPSVPAWVEFQENLKRWLAGPPAPEQLEVVGNYNLF